MQNKFSLGNNVLFVFCVLLLLVSCAKREKVHIKKVAHFYISSHNAQNIFRIFTKQFGLAVVWDYQNWGGFSSGGITMGNVVFEVIDGGPDQSQTYYGIALEPSQSLRRTIPFLDAVNISHGRISKSSQWNTLSLSNILPDKSKLFLCAYHDRDFIALDRKKAADKLVLNNRGALGILFLSEIVIGTKDPIDVENKLAKIPGIVKNGKTFKFSEGPHLKLIASELPGLGHKGEINQ
jgi:hypothetical protein